MTVQQPKILLWDIETLPMIKRAWSLYQEHGQYDEIVHDMSIICVNYKWLGEKKVYTLSVLDQYPSRQKLTFKEARNDTDLIKKFVKVYNTAHFSIGHNVVSFDAKKFRGRMLLEGLRPLAPTKEYDTLKIARKHFSVASNRLDALGQMLGIGKKVKTDYSWWIACEQGDVKAIRKMCNVYGKRDVFPLLEKVYLKLRAWDPIHPNMNLLMGTDNNCPNCGSSRVIKRNFEYHYTRLTKTQRYQCKDCGAWPRKLLSGKGVMR